MNVLKAEKKLAVISALTEGCSIRSIVRMTGVHKKTIMKLLVEVGTKCEQIMKERKRGIRCEAVERDETWTFVGKKEGVMKADERKAKPEFGNQYTSEMQTSLRIAQESADAAKNTAITMEETAERELRAYMMVNEAEIVNDPEPGYSGAYVYIHIKNFGQTPATDIRLATSALIRERPLSSPPLILDPSIKLMTLGILAPGDTLRSRFEIPLMEGTGNGFDIAKRTHAFYVFGIFQYRDAFHHERVTRFCYMRTGEYWTTNGHMDVCQEGNDAT